MKQLVANEPVASLFVGLVTAVCALLVAFGVALTTLQIGAIVGVVVAAIPVVLWVRSKVTPVHKT